MKIRSLLVMSAIAAIAMIPPSGHAAASVCGGTAPRDVACSVEGLIITADNPNMQIHTTLFVGVVTAEMVGPTGKVVVSCENKLDPTYEQQIRKSCHLSKYGIIYKGDTVNVTATAGGRPGAIPAVGQWAVQYSAS